MKYSLEEVNKMSQEEFTQVFGDIFEHTPEIAVKAAAERPFSSLGALHQSMVNVVEKMSEKEKLTLIKAHPDLGSKAKMAEASVQEQAGVGLDRLTAAEFNRFQELNQAYKNRFGFPFIVAVKHHTKKTILQAFQQRLQNTQQQEQQQAIAEIIEIARLRLQSLLD